MNVVFDMAIDALLGRIEKRVRLMTILARNLAMVSEQRELCQVVIEADVVGPGQLRMALPAVVAELHFVRIILLVTTDAAGRRQAVGNRGQMAARTFEVGVGVIQWEIGIDGMIEANVEPLRLAMAVLAFRSVYAVVRIVLEMTADAFVGRLDFEFVAFMAGLACQARMAVDQREGCRREVVECGFFPVDRGVAILTLGPIHAHVRIVFAMTPDASRRRLDVLLADVTADTRKIPMRSGQCIAAPELVVVEGIGPFGFTVTVRADFAEIAHVLIVFQMA